MKQKILIVDDIYPNRFLLEELLSDYECHVAANGEQMREVLKNVVPDLILMDIGLPGEDGLHLAAKISADARLGDVPIVFLTAHSSKKDIIEGIKAGGMDYLVKPIDDDLLVTRIRAALDKKRAEKRARETEGK